MRQTTNSVFMVSDYCRSACPNNSKLAITILRLNRPESRLFRRRRLFVVDLRLGLGGWLRRSGLVYTHNPRSAAAFFVDRDQRAVQANFTSGHRKRGGHVRNKTIHDWFNRPAK